MVINLKLILKFCENSLKQCDRNDSCRAKKYLLYKNIVAQYILKTSLNLSVWYVTHRIRIFQIKAISIHQINYRPYMSVSFFKSYNLRKEEANGLDFLEKK